MIIPEVEIPEEAQRKHELLLAKENQQLIRSKAANLKAIEAIKQALEKPDADPMLGVKIADLENAVDQIEHQLQNPKPLVLHGTDKIMFEGLNKTYHSRVANLEMNRGKVFNVILGQCDKLSSLVSLLTRKDSRRVRPVDLLVEMSCGDSIRL